MSRLEGKATLVTGAASGIGLATARRFAAEGARVTVARWIDTELIDTTAPAAERRAHLP